MLQNSLLNKMTFKEKQRPPSDGRWVQYKYIYNELLLQTFETESICSPEIAKESNNFSKNSQHQKGLNSLHIEADLVYDRAEWRNKIHLADHS